MDNEKLEKLLSDVICTSKLESGFAKKEPSLELAAYTFAEINDPLNEIEYQYLANYDGYGIGFIKDLEKSLELTNSVQQTYLDELKSFKPEPKNYSKYRVRIKELASENFRKYCRSLNQYINKSHRRTVSVMEMTDETHYKLKGPLKTLAKSLIKEKAINRVIEAIALEGKFNVKKEFESVPAACKFYKKALNNSLTRGELKSQLKKFAVFYEKGEELGWETINKRINSWVDHENQKPNTQNIPHK